ncbi:MAG TPA: hypothetical protein VF940_03905 [Streptosporangiaceae bacterium]
MAGADEWPLPSRFLGVGDDHYVHVGEGPTLVHLARRHQPAPRDIPLRRAGFSRHRTVQPNHRDRVRIAAYADELDAVVDRLRLDDTTLVMYYMRGAVGLTHAPPVLGAPVGRLR